MTAFLLVCAAIICGAVGLAVFASFISAAYMAFAPKDDR
jgi:hypothetical protein